MTTENSVLNKSKMNGIENKIKGNLFSNLYIKTIKWINKN